MYSISNIELQIVRISVSVTWLASYPLNICSLQQFWLDLKFCQYPKNENKPNLKYYIDMIIDRW